MNALDENLFRLKWGHLVPVSLDYVAYALEHYCVASHQTGCIPHHRFRLGKDRGIRKKQHWKHLSVVPMTLPAHTIEHDHDEETHTRWEAENEDLLCRFSEQLIAKQIGDQHLDYTDERIA